MPLNADTPSMVDARASVQHGPVLARVRQRVTKLAAGVLRDRGADVSTKASAYAPIVVDLACGTGTYLASALIEFIEFLAQMERSKTSTSEHNEQASRTIDTGGVQL